MPRRPLSCPLSFSGSPTGSRARRNSALQEGRRKHRVLFHDEPNLAGHGKLLGNGSSCDNLLPWLLATNNGSSSPHFHSFFLSLPLSQEGTTKRFLLCEWHPRGVIPRFSLLHFVMHSLLKFAIKTIVSCIFNIFITKMAMLLLILTSPLQIFEI